MHTGRVITYWGHDICETCKGYHVIVLYGVVEDYYQVVYVKELDRAWW